MNIAQAKENLELILVAPQPITPYMHGKPGIGKSAIVQQIANDRDIAFIDLRLSQLESADIRGIPHIEVGSVSSKWYPPETIPFEVFADLPVPGDPKGRLFGGGGILFLDEINRARFDVIQAAFQLVLDRQVGLHKILSNWFIVCAGNLGEEDKTEVTEISDSALNNRFIHYKISDSGLFDCWMDWAEKNEVHQDVLTFLKTKPSYLYTDPQEGEEVFCTPRTWDKFSQILKQNNSYTPEFINQRIGRSILGPAAIQFAEYLKLRKEIKPGQIFESYNKLKSEVKKLSRDRKYALTNELVAYLKSYDKPITKAYFENFHNFTNDNLDADAAMALYRQFTEVKVTFNKSKDSFTSFYLDFYPDMMDKIGKLLNESKE